MGKTLKVSVLRWTIRFEASTDPRRYDEAATAVKQAISDLTPAGEVIVTGPIVIRVPVQ